MTHRLQIFTSVTAVTLSANAIAFTQRRWPTFSHLCCVDYLHWVVEVKTMLFE